MNAITDDASAHRLASNSSRSVHTVLVLRRAEGTVSDSHTGPLSEGEMRARLDELVAE